GVCSCIANYYGPSCDLQCQCVSKGTAKCNDGVDGDGSCLCKPHFAGATCNMCDTFYYGDTCEHMGHPKLTELETKALSISNLVKGVVCGGHGSILFDVNSQSGLVTPTGCACDKNYFGMKDFTWPYSTDCTMLDAISLSSAAAAMRGHSGCVQKGASSYATTAYQVRCESPCLCNPVGTEHCINEQFQTTRQGECTCKPTFTGTTCHQCVPNYYGDNCDIFCSPEVTCQGRGQCSETGLCVCENGWFGTNCERLTCMSCNGFGSN
ncbi:unnamed protein product, partial [Amoebophrya sp. A25]